MDQNYCHSETVQKVPMFCRLPKKLSLNHLKDKPIWMNENNSKKIKSKIIRKSSLTKPRSLYDEFSKPTQTSEKSKYDFRDLLILPETLKPIQQETQRKMDDCSTSMHIDASQMTWKLKQSMLLELFKCLQESQANLQNRPRLPSTNLKATRTFHQKKHNKLVSVKKISKFWNKKSLQTPVVFRKVKLDLENSCVIELHDLIKASSKYRFKN